MTFAAFLSILHLPHFIYITICLSLKFLGYVVKPNGNVFDVCVTISVSKVTITTIERLPNNINRKNISQMKITILYQCSHMCLMRGVFL